MLTEYSELSDSLNKLKGDQLSTRKLLEYKEGRITSLISTESTNVKLSAHIETLETEICHIKEQHLIQREYHREEAQILRKSIETLQHSLTEKTDNRISWLNETIKKLRERNLSLIEESVKYKVRGDSLQDQLNHANEIIDQLNQILFEWNLRPSNYSFLNQRLCLFNCA
jgi:chromosome segregation ATPase